jgi:hypothetical protein
LKRTFAIIAAAMLMLVAVAAVASEDWRGDNRLAGSVVDKNTGAAVKGAKLMLRIQKGSNGGPDITADANGKWAVLGLAAGSWNIDVEAPGYVVRKIGPISFQQGQRLPPVKIGLEPQVVSAADTSTPAEAAHEEVKIGGKTVSKDIADAVVRARHLEAQGVVAIGVAAQPLQVDQRFRDDLSPERRRSGQWLHANLQPHSGNSGVEYDGFGLPGGREFTDAGGAGIFRRDESLWFVGFIAAAGLDPQLRKAVAPRQSLALDLRVAEWRHGNSDQLGSDAIESGGTAERVRLRVD